MRAASRADDVAVHSRKVSFHQALVMQKSSVAEIGRISLAPKRVLNFLGTLRKKKELGTHACSW